MLTFFPNVSPQMTQLMQLAVADARARANRAADLEASLMVIDYNRLRRHLQHERMLRALVERRAERLEHEREALEQERQALEYDIVGLEQVLWPCALGSSTIYCMRACACACGRT